MGHPAAETCLLLSMVLFKPHCDDAQNGHTQFGNPLMSGLLHVRIAKAPLDPQHEACRNPDMKQSCHQATMGPPWEPMGAPWGGICPKSCHTGMGNIPHIMATWGWGVCPKWPRGDFTQVPLVWGDFHQKILLWAETWSTEVEIERAGPPGKMRAEIARRTLVRMSQVVPW